MSLAVGHAAPLVDHDDHRGETGGPLRDLFAFVLAQPWRRLAACADDPDPSRWHSSDLFDLTHAARVCCGCPVWRECLTHALTEPERSGVWAATVEGSSRSGRRRMRARLARGVDLDAVLDEHLATLDPAGPGVLAPAVERVARSSRRGSVGPADLAALARGATRTPGGPSAPDGHALPVRPVRVRTEAHPARARCSCAVCSGGVERGRAPVHAHA